MSDYLPPELVVNILARLPIKSILRCTAVCKSWYVLISSPDFISTSLNRKQDEYILIRNYFELTHVEVYALFGNNRRLYNYLDFSFCNCSVRIVGSLNGILCLSDVDNSNNFYFCNPSIRKWIQLPEPCYVCERGFGRTLGFGFDCVTNDYKVVRIEHTKAHAMPPRVDIYKYNTGVWEDISHVSGSYLFSTATPYVYVNGACHWITSKLELDISSCGRVIVVFNMHDETFSDMVLPRGLALTDASRTHFDEMFLYVSEESLCLVDNKYDKSEPINIWMMREYGVPDSWVKHFSIQNDLFGRILPLRSDIIWAPYVGNAAPTELEIANEFMRPMALKKNGEILWKGSQRLLVSVDSTVDNFKDVESGNCTNDWCCDPCYVSYYKESLVLLDRRKNICIGDACEESSDLFKREPKDGKRRISRGKSKYKMRIASLLHISGLLYMSKMKWKWLRKKGRKSMKVKKPSLSNELAMLQLSLLGFRLTMKTSFDVWEGQSFHVPEVYGTFNTLGY